MKGTGCQAAAELSTTAPPRPRATMPGQHVGRQVDDRDAVEADHLDLRAHDPGSRAPGEPKPAFSTATSGRRPPRRSAARQAASPSSVARSAPRARVGDAVCLARPVGELAQALLAPGDQQGVAARGQALGEGPAQARGGARHERRVPASARLGVKPVARVAEAGHDEAALVEALVDGGDRDPAAPDRRRRSAASPSGAAIRPRRCRRVAPASRRRRGPPRPSRRWRSSGRAPRPRRRRGRRAGSPGRTSGRAVCSSRARPEESDPRVVGQQVERGLEHRQPRPQDRHERHPARRQVDRRGGERAS